MKVLLNRQKLQQLLISKIKKGITSKKEGEIKEKGQNHYQNQNQYRIKKSKQQKIIK